MTRIEVFEGLLTSRVQRDFGKMRHPQGHRLKTGLVLAIQGEQTVHGPLAQDEQCRTDLQALCPQLRVGLR